ncbi:long-chain fatty acid transport protein 6-like [Acipenser oxyrinchus oxyrinchus]|uniref:long-chain-fatty-acid--CoA ligase n=1 Tax=Acipenser oxyrinchus oxyrinchus TaxID=40147 RepID=A0AAD8GI07_ACIOX|nr:long-chain fatty acid transport protein 6-like [Acipenser oxyrinchus oxyrinchus]
MLFSLITAAAAGLAAVLTVQKLFYPYFWDDLIYYMKLQRVKRMMKLRMRHGVITLLDCFVQQAKKIPNKPFIIHEGDLYTYQDMDKRSNKVAQVFLQQGSLKKGDIAAVLMSNEPDFISVWFGLSKLGCEVAFLNFNIKSKSLLHCFNSCGATTLVVGADLITSLEDVLLTLQNNGINIWLMEKSSTFQGVNTILDKLEHASDDPVPLDVSSQTNIMSTFLYIFTSGTTGLPKAARISHLKAVMCLCFFQMCGATSDDIIYVTLPLYHMSASLLGIGGCIELGAACVLKKKFSASQFWNDCRKHNVTVFQYIGELCRYLVNQPKVAGEMDHKVRIAAGSGLRPDVWKDFHDRFGKIKVVESYGLTEASIGFMNYTDKTGPIGRAGFFNKCIFPFDFVKYDLQKAEPVRSDQGYCVKIKKGETGLLIAPVTSMNPFLGYAGNKELSEKKLLRNVFEKGDVFFNTGDFMMQDHDDFVYFRDRTGDTFRWKGENVATTEVADILGVLEFLQEVNVYGVSVPGHEGKAGMVAVVLKPEHKLDGRRLYSHLAEHLPAYSWPRFVRVQASLDVTETFKQQKGRLVEEGFSPSAVSEALYFLDESEKTYIPLNKNLFDAIVSGQIRL